MRFKLIGTSDMHGATIRIHYPSAESRNLVKDGKIIEFNQWDEGERQYGSIKQGFCGENRYIGIKNIFEFFLTPGCEIKIQPRDAIQCMVRMEWTFAEFFFDGGTTKFVDRLASSLGIHGSDIKVVAVYEGSVIIEYLVMSATDDPQDLENIKARQTELFATDSMQLGGSLLDMTADEIAVIRDGVVSADGY